jgi:hypothetical protein
MTEPFTTMQDLIDEHGWGDVLHELALFISEDEDVCQLPRESTWRYPNRFAN